MKLVGRFIPLTSGLVSMTGLDDPVYSVTKSKHNNIGARLTSPEGAAVPGKAEETDGWLLGQSYDTTLDQMFLEIRDAQTLELEARVWTGEHLPLGFHGNFYSRT